MNPRSGSLGTIVQVNVQLAMASLCGFAAWQLWPSNAEWWGLGIASVLLGLGSLGGVVGAIRAAVDLHARERALADYLAQGGVPKSSHMAGEQDLRNAGMLP